MTLVLVQSGCDRQTTRSAAGSAASDEKLYLGLIGPDASHPLSDLFSATSLAWADGPRFMGVRQIRPPEAGAASVAQVLETLDDPRLGGLCIWVEDAEPLVPALEGLHRRGVRIVSLNVRLPASLTVGHVGVDDEAVGRMLARLTGDALADADPASIMLLHAGTVLRESRSRLHGFEAAMKLQSHVDVFASVNCQGDPERACREIAERSPRFPRLSAWVSLEDWPLRGPGALSLPESCRLITAGGFPRQWDLVRSGTLPGFVAWDYRQMVMRGLEICETAVNSTLPGSPVIELPPRLIRADELDAWIREWNSWSRGTPGSLSPSAGGSAPAR